MKRETGYYFVKANDIYDSWVPAFYLGGNSFSVGALVFTPKIVNETRILNPDGK